MADKVHKQGEHILQQYNHPYISSSGTLGGTISMHILLHNTTHALAVYTLYAHVHRQNGVQQLIHSAPTIEKRWSYVEVTLKTKRKSTTPRELSGY